MGLALVLLTVKGTGASDLYATANMGMVQSDPYGSNSVVQPNSENSLAQQAYLTTIQENTVMPRNQVLAVLFDTGTDSRRETSIYEVQPGDVLSGIAKDFGLHTETLVSANNIKNINALKPGMELKIPPVDGILYTIKSGDTVSVLAKKYQAESDKIISFNDLPLSGDLRIGDNIIIPDGKAPKSGGSTIGSGSSSSRFSALPKIEGYFMTPATCVITQLAHVRNGYDCANKTGTPIYAAAAGNIDLVQYSNKGYGHMVRISHQNGTKTLYGHFSKIYVKTGQTVTQGQPIGEMGNTGYSTGPHLHFEIQGAYNILARYGMRGQVIAGQ